MPNETPMPQEGERNPLHHTRKMCQSLQDISDRLREDIAKMEEPQAKAMFETSAEVLDGLVKAFKDYEQKCEKGWRV